MRSIETRYSGIKFIRQSFAFAVFIGLLSICMCSYASSGDDRVNIAIGTVYTWNIAPNYALTYSNPGNNVHLTGGRLSDGHWLNGATVVWQGGESVVVTLDLEELQSFNELNVRVTVYPPAGIDPISKVTYMVSGEGIEFKLVDIVEVSDVKGSDVEKIKDWEVYNFRLVGIAENARFVRVQFDYERFLCVDQIQVIRGVSKDESISERPWERVEMTNPTYEMAEIQDDGWRPDLEGPIWKQEDFVIGLWWPPPVAHTNVDTYRVIADAGFNLVIGGNDVSGEYRKLMLEVASQVGIKCLVNPPPLVSEIVDYVKYDSLMGFLIKDEPFYDELQRWGEMVRAYQQEFGVDYVAAIDLLPSYAMPSWLGYSYEGYVDKAVRTGNLPLLMVNIYPLQPQGGINAEFFRTMEVMRKYSLRYEIPWWSFMQTAKVQWSRTPTEPEIRWQAYMLVAYGAKGILYYCYWEDIGHSKVGSFPDAGIAGALVDSSGRTKANYFPVRKLNHELIEIAPILMQLRSKEVSYYGMVPLGAREFINNKEWGRLTASGFLVIGEFVREDDVGDVVCLVLVNTDTTFSNSVNVKIQSDGKTTYKVYGSDISENDALEVTLEPGDGTILEIYTHH